ncbi:motility associated factor glycosyltransferase family protein [Orenia marismortui]|uniref:DUF115 domain-containing protein n=1 Tax=Orenia marismortui TaxID=46469 RepID=A0A4R8HQ97_9FIRM|nr:6-hydroxymethylpterin diphosphokinase MptE-like protein [Orenia marismortui]TDX58903.1 hypothetical protein C7959_10241 [Orenia marismortui]
MLDKNLEALRNKSIEIIDKLHNVKNQEQLKIIDARNGSKTACFNMKNQSLMLHSKYNPIQEAERIVDKINLDGLNSVIVLGFGLGYHILSLFNRIKDKGIKLFIVENDPALFKEALKYHDFSDIFNYDEFYLFLKPNIKKYELYNFINENVDIIFENIEILSLPSVFKYNRDYYNLALEEIKESIYKIEVNRYTTLKLGKNWDKYFLENIDLTVNECGIDNLKNLAKEQPVIIVSAGPSLNKNMMDLKAAKGKALIIAVNTALKPLLRKKIIPDIVITIEESKDLEDHLSNLDQIEGITSEMIEDMVLVFDPRVYPDVLRDWPGHLMVASLDFDSYIMNWLEKFMEYKGRIFSGGSVAHAALAFSYHIGADPIILVGQDLAFSETRTHVDGAPGKGSFIEDKLKNPKQYLQIEGINGEKLWTRIDYYRYLQYFNRMLKFADKNRTFIDATEGGARIEETEVMSLKKSIAKYCIEKSNINTKILDKIKSFKPQWGEGLLLEIRNIIDNISSIKDLARKGLEVVDQLIDALSSGEQDEVDRLNLKLENLNKRITQLKDNIIFYESEIHELHGKRNFAKKNSYDILNDFVDFYNRLTKGSTNTLNILNEKYEQLKRMGAQ